MKTPNVASIFENVKSYIETSAQLLSLSIQNRLRSHRHITLAVVGERSSGKSFLLQDMMRSLRGMGVERFNTLKNKSGQVYKGVMRLNPDEQGGSGGTPLYAYRQSKHYGNYIDQLGGFDLDFLNIPGEAFFEADVGQGRRISALEAYFNLQEKLLGTGKIFIVRLYKGPVGFLKVVEPLNPSETYIADKAHPFTYDNKKQEEEMLNLRFRTCSELYGYLQTKQYKECPAWGYPRKIDGKKLLQGFFDFDADSIMTALCDVTSIFEDLGFGAVDFKSQYDRPFAFIHYCAQATDMVICDRIYTPKGIEGNSDEGFDFGKFCDSLLSFKNKAFRERKINIYLAFRNVDFLLAAKEPNYKDLYLSLKRLLAGEEKPAERIRNAVYSLFHYAALEQLYNHENGTMTMDKLLYQLIGETTPEQNEALTTLLGDVKDIPEKYVDFTEEQGVVYNDADAKTHITNRIGENGGSGFLDLLGNVNSQVLPHIYFTCSPMTRDCEIYTNCTDGTNDFERIREDGERLLFSRCGSRACFGAYQLCMDILLNHNIGQFENGALLRQIQGNVD